MVFTTDPTPISYILTETLTGLTDDAVVTITYIEEPPVANDDSSSGNTVGMNAIANLLTNDQLSDGTQATTSNTSVVLIDPATGIPTVYTKCSYHSWTRCSIPLTLPQEFDVWSVWWLLLQILHLSVISHGNIDRIDRQRCSDNHLYWTTTGCHWR